MFGLLKNEYEKFIDEVIFDCSFSLSYAVSVTDVLGADLIKIHRSSMFKTISEMDNLNIKFLEYYKGRVEFKLATNKQYVLWQFQGLYRKLHVDLGCHCNSLIRFTQFTAVCNFQRERAGVFGCACIAGQYRPNLHLGTSQFVAPEFEVVSAQALLC